MEVSGTGRPPRGSAEREAIFRAGRGPILPSARHPSTPFYLPTTGRSRSAGLFARGSQRKGAVGSDGEACFAHFAGRRVFEPAAAQRPLEDSPAAKPLLL